MKSLLNYKARIMSLCNHNGNNNINDLSQAFMLRNNCSYRTNTASSFTCCLVNAILLCIVVSNTAKAVEGNVGIHYSISSIQGAYYGLNHYAADAKEGLDNHDGRYYEMHSPSGVSAKAVGSVEGVELDNDARPPTDPPSGASVSLSIVTSDDNPVYIPAGTSHWIDVSVSGYEGYKVIVSESLIGGGNLPEGWYDDGQSTGSVSISFESISPPLQKSIPQQSTQKLLLI